MRYGIPEFNVGLTLLRMISVVAICGVFLAPDNALAACTTKYKTECVETDDDGRCKRYERVSYEECTEEKESVHVSPPKQECFECFEYNNDGSCKKTKKVSC